MAAGGEPLTVTLEEDEEEVDDVLDLRSQSVRSRLRLSNRNVRNVGPKVLSKKSSRMNRLSRSAVGRSLNMFEDLSSHLPVPPRSGQTVFIMGNTFYNGRSTHEQPQDRNNDEEQKRKKRKSDCLKAWTRLINALRDKYSKHTAWIIPLEDLPSTQLKLEYCFDPKLRRTDFRGIQTLGELELPDLLSGVLGDPNIPKRVLIRGESGFGKTTLCLLLAYYWAKEERIRTIHSFELVIHYRLKELPIGMTLEEALIGECVRWAGRKIDESDMPRLIEKRAKSILVILDGYDELSKERRELVDFFLHGDPNAPRCSVFQQSTIVITTRRIQNDVKHFRSIDRYIMMAGLSEENQQRFVDKFFMDRNKPNLFSVLKENLDKMQLGFLPKLSPMMLYLICFLIHEGDIVITENNTMECLSSHAIYGKICRLMGRKYNTTKNLGMNVNEMDRVFVEIGKMLFNASIGQNKPVYKACFEEDQFTDENRQWRKFILNFGLIRRQVSVKHESPKSYEPIHPSFGLFLAGSHLMETAGNLTNDSEVLSFIGHPELHERVQTAFRQTGKPRIDVISYAYVDCDIVLKLTMMDGRAPNQLLKVQAFRWEDYMQWANQEPLDFDEFIRQDMDKPSILPEKPRKEKKDNRDLPKLTILPTPDLSLPKKDFKYEASDKFTEVYLAEELFPGTPAAKPNQKLTEKPDVNKSDRDSRPTGAQSSDFEDLCSFRLANLTIEFEANEIKNMNKQFHLRDIKNDR